MPSTPDPIIDALKAAGEPTRLRILALLRRGDLAVGELVQILDQSQPRLSHHLKTLTTSGLVERLPEGAWVFYRARSKGWAGRILHAIFAELDTEAALYTEDRKALKKVRHSRAQSAETYFSEIAESWDQLRALHYPEAEIERAILSEVEGQSFDRIVDLVDRIRLDGDQDGLDLAAVASVGDQLVVPLHLIHTLEHGFFFRIRAG